MKLSTALPVNALRDCVLGFEQREADIESNVVFPIAARPHQFLEFYLQGKYLVESCDSRARDVVPQAVVVGPSTYRSVDLVLHGHLAVFTIQFQPSGFHRLFGIPMPELTDRALDAISSRTVILRAGAQARRCAQLQRARPTSRELPA